MTTYVVAGSRPWNRRVFDEHLASMPGTWRFADTREKLDAALAESPPEKIFFLHWSWKVDLSVLERFECICFHMTDVPFGRGGSPLQNLIARGVMSTQLTALRMTEEFDAGPVYLKEPLSLYGGAEEIFIRACELSATMVKRIVDERIAPVPQIGDPVTFARRRPDESRIDNPRSLAQFFDFVRMLDAKDYPKAFLEHGDFRLEFTRPALYDGRLVADVVVTRRDSKERGVT